MGLMDKIWDEVFAAPSPRGAPNAAPHLPHATTLPHRREMNLKLDVSMDDLPDSPRGGLERSDSSPPASPSPRTFFTDGLGGRVSGDFGESKSVGPPESKSVRPAASQKISINPAAAGPRRKSLDTAHSLPPGYRYMPDILSPGSRKDGENVWRSVFNPGTNKNMDNIGASKFDKADPKGPSVYDWYNPLGM